MKRYYGLRGKSGPCVSAKGNPQTFEPSALKTKVTAGAARDRLISGPDACHTEAISARGLFGCTGAELSRARKWTSQ